MATFRETFLCTALPESVAGTKVRVAVLVSPRLVSDSSADAPLDSWPDVRDWPSIRPTWQITITQGSTTVTLPAAEVSGPYDGTGWGQLFPATMPTIPYQPIDRSATPIFSYPVAKVRDAVRELHLQVLTGSRTEFPTVEALQAMPRFVDLKKAADDVFVAEVVKSQGKDPVPDAATGIDKAFAMVPASYGVRPGSEPPPAGPTVTSVVPSSHRSNNPPPERITITGENFTRGPDVFFGEKSATVEGVNAAGTVIFCLLPTPPPGALPITVDVTVLTEFGTSPVTPQTKYTYLPPEGPR